MSAQAAADTAQASAARHLYRIAARHEDGVIRVEALEGFWTEPLARAYIAHLTDEMRLCRVHSAALRILVDMRRTPVLPVEVAEAFGTVERLIGPDDSFALLVGSRLSKMQTSRIASVPNLRSFLTEQEACDWLGIDPA
jgi:hypothetical protein